MDNSLQALCNAIKKILSQLKPQNNHLSFIIITGKTEQGKSAFLKQSHLKEIPLFNEDHAKLYFNQQGIVVELGENWLTNSRNLLQNTFKQLNRCNKHLKITGLIFCIEVNDLLISNISQFAEQKKAHLQLLNRFGANLGYPVELAVLITKMDHLAGFTEFYQTDHTTELDKPLGFSLNSENNLRKKIEAFTSQFHHFIEIVGRQVIPKMHPARSTIKRSLIREFPLQLASLRAPIRAFLQGISPKWFHLHSLYFTSSEQGGLSVDHLNKKIQHEYALVIQDSFPQASNYRAFFVEGALKHIQEQWPYRPNIKTVKQKSTAFVAAGIVGLSLLALVYHHFKAVSLLDETSKELLAYDTLKAQGSTNSQALFHLSKASQALNHSLTSSISAPSMQQLTETLQQKTQNKLQGEFLPSLVEELEQTIVNPGNTPIARYQALKIYLMFSDSKYWAKEEIQNWYNNQWINISAADKAKQLVLLEEILNKPLPALDLKPQIISDARNYLNALPLSYLYYSIAKELFPKEKETISIEGFSLATNELPIYYTQKGFANLIKELPEITNQLQQYNWVLGRDNLPELNKILMEAYCFDYITWWQSFMRKSQPLHYQDYQQGKILIKQLQQFNSINKMMRLIQQETKPDLKNENSLFNQMIAYKFTDLNLISQSSPQDLNKKIAELERFIATLSMINDQGKTVFTITRTRFLNEHASDPISQLYAQAQQLPEPLNSWAQQIAGDSWVLLIKESRLYINQQWQNTVFTQFKNNIDKRYPFDANQAEEISIQDFNRFFATHGLLNAFSEQYIKPFLDITNADWKPKSVNGYVVPISEQTLDGLIRANIITTMFFPDHGEESSIHFSLQKINLDPVVTHLNLQIGKTQLKDTQESNSFMNFTWPQNNAKLSLDSVEGNHYELAEKGIWALFKLLEKVNVLIDEQDSSSLQILFEVNSNSGRYLLKTNHQINPFTPGILNGFTLGENVV